MPSLTESAKIKVTSALLKAKVTEASINDIISIVESNIIEKDQINLVSLENTLCERYNSDAGAIFDVVESSIKRMADKELDDEPVYEGEDLDVLSKNTERRLDDIKFQLNIFNNLCNETIDSILEKGFFDLDE